VSIKRTYLSFLTSIFSLFILVCPCFGYIYNENGSFLANHTTPDSALDLSKVFPQSHPSFSSFSLNENDWKKSGLKTQTSGKIPVLEDQISPELDQRFSFYQGDYSDEKNLTSPPLAGFSTYSVAQRKINYTKASMIGGLNLAAIIGGLHQAMNTWGKSKGKFHVKDDWKGDGLAQTDELSHFMWGYKMTQFLYGVYSWAGFSSKTSQTLSVSQSSLILTLVEYPIDAYNPQQGLGVSDLIFDYLGVGLAVARKHYGWLNDFDFKISWKKNIVSENKTPFAQTYQEYDNFIYWLTYRPKLFLPQKLVCFGFGYSVTHSGFEPQREFYGGIGLSLPDCASLFGKKFGERSRFLEIIYPNVRIKL
jgi:hypothetical protein